MVGDGGLMKVGGDGGYNLKEFSNYNFTLQSLVKVDCSNLKI